MELVLIMVGEFSDSYSPEKRDKVKRTKGHHDTAKRIVDYEHVLCLGL